jgi:DNA-binding transcriptional LysR family regulator
MQLEAETGLQLIRREKGRIVLTKDGLTFYDRATETLAAFGKLRASVKDLQRNPAPEIRILATMAISTTVGPAMISKLLSRHADFRARLITLDNESYLSARCETEYDILIGPKIGLSATMDQIVLAEADFVCAMPKGHPLAARPKVTIDDLAGETLISIIDDETRTFLNHDILLREASLTVDTAIKCHASVAAYGLVSRGHGIALLEPFSAGIWRNNGVVTRPFRPRLTYAFTAGLKPDAFQSGIMSEVVQVARETFAEFAPKAC